MTNEQLYTKAQSTVLQRRQLAIAIAKEHEAELNVKIPQYKTLTDKRLSLGIKAATMGATFADKALIDEAIAQIKQLDDEIKALLLQNKLSEDYAKVKYTCSLCRDTARVNGEICRCVHALAQDMRRQELSKSSPLSLCSFDSFLISKYTDAKAREIMQGMLNYCKEYAEDFSKNSSSLYICGSAGIGKTHLALSIANEVIKKGYDVVYVSSQGVFDKIEREHFQANSADTMESLLETDLLILDDLGTEYLTPFVGSCLYDIINTRWNKKLPTIYTSNFVRENEFKARYTEKIVSRLFGSCEILYFVGNDIRLG